MPYLKLPDGSYFTAPEGTPKEVALELARKKYPEAFDTRKPEEGFIPAMKAAGMRQLSGYGLAASGIGALDEATARAADAKTEEQIRKHVYKPVQYEGGDDSVKGALAKYGWFNTTPGSEAPGGGVQLLKFWRDQLGGMAPQLATTAAGAWGGAKLGAMTGSPLGVGAGALLGGAAAALPGFQGSNLQAQVEQQKTTGEAPLEHGRALAAAVPQAATESAMQLFVLGRGLGFGQKSLELLSTKTAAEQAAALARRASENLAVAAGKGVVRGVAAEVPVELSQQVLERWQARQDILGPDAMKDYEQTAVGTLGPAALLGMAGGAHGRRAAKQQQDEQQRAVAEAARKKELEAEEAKKKDPATLAAHQQDIDKLAARAAKINEMLTSGSLAGKDGKGVRKAAKKELESINGQIKVLHGALKEAGVDVPDAAPDVSVKDKAVDIDAALAEHEQRVAQGQTEAQLREKAKTEKAGASADKLIDQRFGPAEKEGLGLDAHLRRMEAQRLAEEAKQAAEREYVVDDYGNRTRRRVEDATGVMQGDDTGANLYEPTMDAFGREIPGLAPPALRSTRYEEGWEKFPESAHPKLEEWLAKQKADMEARGGAETAAARAEALLKYAHLEYAGPSREPLNQEKRREVLSNIDSGVIDRDVQNALGLGELSRTHELDDPEDAALAAPVIKARIKELQEKRDALFDPSVELTNPDGTFTTAGANAVADEMRLSELRRLEKRVEQAQQPDDAIIGRLDDRIGEMLELKQRRLKDRAAYLRGKYGKDSEEARVVSNKRLDAEIEKLQARKQRLVDARAVSSPASQLIDSHIASHTAQQEKPAELIFQSGDQGHHENGVDRYLEKMNEAYDTLHEAIDDVRRDEYIGGRRRDADENTSTTAAQSTKEGLVAKAKQARDRFVDASLRHIAHYRAAKKMAPISQTEAARHALYLRGTLDHVIENETAKKEPVHIPAQMRSGKVVTPGRTEYRYPPGLQPSSNEEFNALMGGDMVRDGETGMEGGAPRAPRTNAEIIASKVGTTRKLSPTVNTTGTLRQELARETGRMKKENYGRTGPIVRSNPLKPVREMDMAREYAEATKELPDYRVVVSKQIDEALRRALPTPEADLLRQVQDVLDANRGTREFVDNVDYLLNKMERGGTDPALMDQLADDVRAEQVARGSESPALVGKKEREATVAEKQPDLFDAEPRVNVSIRQAEEELAEKDKALEQFKGRKLDLQGMKAWRAAVAERDNVETRLMILRNAKEMEGGSEFVDKGTDVAAGATTQSTAKKFIAFLNSKAVRTLKDYFTPGWNALKQITQETYGPVWISAQKQLEALEARIDKLNNDPRFKPVSKNYPGAELPSSWYQEPRELSPNASMQEVHAHNKAVAEAMGAYANWVRQVEENKRRQAAYDAAMAPLLKAKNRLSRAYPATAVSKGDLPNEADRGKVKEAYGAHARAVAEAYDDAERIYRGVQNIDEEENINKLREAGLEVRKQIAALREEHQFLLGRTWAGQEELQASVDSRLAALDKQAKEFEAAVQARENVGLDAAHKELANAMAKNDKRIKAARANIELQEAALENATGLVERALAVPVSISREYTTGMAEIPKPNTKELQRVQRALAAARREGKGANHLLGQLRALIKQEMGGMSGVHTEEVTRGLTFMAEELKKEKTDLQKQRAELTAAERAAEEKREKLRREREAFEQRRAEHFGQKVTTVQKAFVEGETAFEDTKQRVVVKQVRKDKKTETKAQLRAQRDALRAEQATVPEESLRFRELARQLHKIKNRLKNARAEVVVPQEQPRIVTEQAPLEKIPESPEDRKERLRAENEAKADAVRREWKPGTTAPASEQLQANADASLRRAPNVPQDTKWKKGEGLVPSKRRKVEGELDAEWMGENAGKRWVKGKGWVSAEKEIAGRKPSPEELLADTETGGPEEYEADDGRFSRGTNAEPTGNTAARVVTALKAKFNSDRGLSRLTTVVQSEAELPAAIRNHPNYKEGTRGVAHNDRVYLVADNIEPGKELGVFLHEAGAHLGFDKVMSKNDRLWLRKQVEGWARGTDATAKLAREAIKQAGDPAGVHFDDEVVAYMTEKLVDAGVTPQTYSKEGGWLRKLWAAFKTALRRVELQSDITPKQLVDLAFGAARMEVAGMWHGDPNSRKFYHFSLAHRGTGEGGLPQGDENFEDTIAHGVYIAEDREVGEFYRDQNRRKKNGSLYSVDFDLDKGEVLHRDRPFKDQPRAVKDVLEKTGVLDDLRTPLQWQRNGVGNEIESYPPVRVVGGYESYLIGKHKDGTYHTSQVHRPRFYEDGDQDLYFGLQKEGVATLQEMKALVQAHREAPDGAEIYRLLSAKLGSDKAASEALSAGGVKAVKYLDSESRKNRSGQTYNYVVFDPKHLTVVKRNPNEEGGVTYERPSTVAEIKALVGSKSILDGAKKLSSRFGPKGVKAVGRFGPVQNAGVSIETGETTPAVYAFLYDLDALDKYGFGWSDAHIGTVSITTGGGGKADLNGPVVHDLTSKVAKKYAQHLAPPFDEFGEQAATFKEGVLSPAEVKSVFRALIDASPEFKNDGKKYKVSYPEILGALPGAHKKMNARPFPTRFSATYAPDYDPALIDVQKRVIAQDKTLRQKLTNFVAGLHQNVVDAQGPFHDTLRKAVNTGALSAKSAMQASYFVREMQRTYNWVSLALSDGVPKIVVNKDGDHVIRGTGEASAKKIIDALQPLVTNGTNSTAVLTAYSTWRAAKRAESLGPGGLEKLNFGVDKDGKPNVTQADLDKALADGNSRPEFLEASRLHDEYNKALVDFAVAAHVFSKEEGDRLNAQKYYIPYYREDGNHNLGVYIDNGKPIKLGNIKNSPYLHELVGGETKILSFEDSIQQNTSLLAGMALQNMAARSAAFELQKIGLAYVVNGNEAGPNVTHFRVEPTGPKDDGKRSAIVGDGANNQQVKQLEKQLSYIPAGSRAHEVVSGKLGRLRATSGQFSGVSGELLVKSMEGVSTSIPLGMRLLAAPANILRRGVTRNPIYAVRQMIRDPFAAWMSTGADINPFTSSFKEVYKIYSGQKEDYVEAQRRGMIGGQVFNGDPDDVKKLMKLHLDSGGKGSFWSTLDELAIRSDGATRVALMKSFEKQGLSELEATMATNASMDFTRRGASATVHMASMMIPFFNAQIQGLDVVYKSLSGNMTVGEKVQAYNKLWKRGALLAGMTIMYVSMMQDDEAYKNADPLTRLNNFFIRVPGLKEPLKVPIPFEFGFMFKSIPETMLLAASKDYKAEALLKGVGRAVVNMSPGGNLLYGPQAIKPLVEAYSNKVAYSGMPIASEQLMRLAPEYRASARTTELAKVIGGMTGQIPGAGEYLSPVMLDHFINGYLGGLGTNAAALASMVMPWGLVRSDVHGPVTKKMSELPFVGAAFQPNVGMGLVSQAYEMAKKAEQAKATYDRLVQTDPEDAKRYGAAHREDIAKAGQARSFKEFESQQNKLEDLVRNAPKGKMTPDEKARIIENIKRAKIERAKRYLNAAG